jgi:hypothetical protein
VTTAPRWRHPHHHLWARVGLGGDRPASRRRRERAMSAAPNGIPFRRRAFDTLPHSPPPCPGARQTRG